MTERNPPSWMQGGNHPAENDRLFISSLVSRAGVVSPGALRVTTTSGMGIRIAAGGSFIQGDTSPNQGVYNVYNDGDIDIDVGTANGANDRIDAVVARILDDAYDGGGSNVWVVEVIAGTPGASPVLPTLPDSCQLLAEVLVDTGTTNLGSYDSITDRRERCILIEGVPVGCMFDFGGATAPLGWFLCDGSAKSRDTYSSLFETIGTAYGVGDGSTTFNIPDQRGRVSVGVGGVAAGRLTSVTDSRGASGGAQNVTLTTSQVPSHTHAAGTLATSSAGSHTHSVEAATGGGGTTSLKIAISTGAGAGRLDTAGNNDHITYSDAIALTAGSHTHTVTGSTAAAGGGTSHNNMQPYIMHNKIIKY